MQKYHLSLNVQKVKTSILSLKMHHQDIYQFFIIKQNKQK